MLKLVFESTAKSIAWPEHEHLLVMPYTSQQDAERSARQLAARAGCDALLLVIEDARREGFIAIANQVFMNTHSDTFAYVAQDAFAGRHWLAIAHETLQQKEAGLLAFNDGKWHGQLASFGLVKRSWVNTLYPGTLFYPGYHSHYADVELTIHALNEKKYCYNPAAMLIEVDWDKEKKSVDARDRACYRQRAAKGFEGKVSSADLLQRFS